MTLEDSWREVMEVCVCDTYTRIPSFPRPLSVCAFLGVSGFRGEKMGFLFVVVVAWLQTDMISLESQAYEAMGS